MLSGCAIVHTRVPFRMQEVEELCDADLEFHFDLKIPSDVHPVDQLPQDQLFSLDAASGIQVCPGHDLVILFLHGNSRVLQISRFSLGLFQFLCQSRQFVSGVLDHLTEDVRSETTSPVDGLDDFFLVALQLSLRGGMELLQIGHRTVCQLKFLLTLFLNELAPECSRHPLKELHNDVINNAVQFLT